MARIYPIPNFPGYGVTKLGKVYSCRMRWKKGKWRLLKPHPHEHGHLTLMLVQNGKFKTVHVHQLVLYTFVGPCPKGMECRHLDGNALNNKKSNLKWGTRKQNRADCIKHGTYWRGGNGQRKVWESTRVRFVKLRKQGWKMADIAAEFKIAKVTLYKYQKIWKETGLI